MSGLARSLALAALLGLGSGCALPMGGASSVPDLQPGEDPTSDSTEGGLWMQVAQVETAVQSAGNRVQDPELEGYVRELVCRIAGPYCPDIRAYVLEVPHFNASMFPNGMLHVWTGLLLRCDNEAQLAAVLGHEIGHYVKRHSLKRWKDLSAKANLLAVFALGMSAVGLGDTAQIAQLATMASLAAYSRENEREADRLGVELMARAGYDAAEAAQMWDYMTREQAAEREDEPNQTPFFLASHPSPGERIGNLREQASALDAPGERATGAEPFRKAMAAQRSVWLERELAQRRFKRSDVLLRQLLAEEPDSAELSYYSGELFRIRAGEGDLERAQRAYQDTLERDSQHPQAHRALGMLLVRLEQGAQARPHLERYLELVPNAGDRAMIEFYLGR